MNKILFPIIVSLFLISFGNQAFAQYDDNLAVFETNFGTIVMEFFPLDAPNHIKNFENLIESGFYEGTLFHRIIPQFMIQGGDPNSKTNDMTTWGRGGATDRINSEFNSIKHDRGIVSMARSQDPNSASSQFFIVHENSHFLDEEYTVFGRIVTNESFETLDSIAAVATDSQNKPLEHDQVRITKTFLVNRSEISNLLTLDKPDRTSSTIVQQYVGNRTVEFNNLRFDLPIGWTVQNVQDKKTTGDSPDIVALGPTMSDRNMPSTITITIAQIPPEKSFDDVISVKKEIINHYVEKGSLTVEYQGLTLNEEKSSGLYNLFYSKNPLFFTTIATGYFEDSDGPINVKFQDIMIPKGNMYYTITYSNDENFFMGDYEVYLNLIVTFDVLEQEENETSTNDDDPISNSIILETIDDKISGGCLIATATYGSEMALEVQQLRELRDNSLLQTESGTSFMGVFNDVYYSFSPIIADYERENPIFKEAVKLAITPMISSLSILNYVDMNSESEVLGYGISLIILNLGMYLGVPAVVIVGIKKRN